LTPRFKKEAKSICCGRQWFAPCARYGSTLRDAPKKRRKWLSHSCLFARPLGSIDPLLQLTRHFRRRLQRGKKGMTAAEFKKKWSRYQGKETSAYQGHFDDLCRLLGQPTPAEADPSGSDFFCFQKRVVKDAELFELHDAPVTSEPTERGFADVWKKGCFAWEYKGKKKNLDEAYRQLLRYRESLLNPPLLVVCDFDRYIIKTNFNGTVQEVYEFTNDHIDRPENLRTLRALFENPDFLKPQRTTAAVTEALAQKIAEVARSLQKRASAELADAKSRAEMNFAQRKNLRIARFLNRIVFCMFAEDTRLLPPDLFTEILKSAIDDPAHFAKTLEDLFKVMATGGGFGQHKIRHFNGHLFDDASVFELNEAELRILGEAAEADWQFIQPSIMGTLFERAMDESQRSQLGAHYTSEADIKTLVEPVLMQPFRREWSKIKGELAPAYAKGKGTAAQRERLARFQKQLAAVTVLDPACGSGNFLYVSLQLLLGLEKEVITFGTQLGFAFKPQASVAQLKAIEINPYAFELAQVSVQIGYLQWRRDNGFDNDRTPVLQNLDGFQNEDALLVPHFRNKAKTLKEAQAGEHAGDDALKFYTEREWPECDVIVGNPPFLGDKLMRGELGDGYVEELRKIYGERIPGQSDLCCYWFEKARELIEEKKCTRAGLLATQGIRGGANREVLKRIKNTGEIFFAESDRKWILNGAMVQVSMVGFDARKETERNLNGQPVAEIHPNLAKGSDTTTAARLTSNEGTGFIGMLPSGPFTIPAKTALEILSSPNAHGTANSDILRPYFNGEDIASRNSCSWVIDFDTRNSNEASKFEAVYSFTVQHIKPIREKSSAGNRPKLWWLFARNRPEFRLAAISCKRFIATARVAKHRLFVWQDACSLPDSATVAFARSDDFFFGLLHSRFHEVWSLAQGTQLREKESGFRYTPSSCFETFPFPRPTAKQEAAIADAAQELNALRERWLNPPEWTVEKFLEFPGSTGGPWQRYLDPKTVNAKSGIGTVRYPRLEPRDADCAAQLKKRTLTNLYNDRPAWLDLAHKQLDAAVAVSYGWPAAITDEEILERLLALNLERAAEETKAAKAKKAKISRAKNAEEML
jgi:type II restriction/modification system DNA methylase subunit YeeA